MAHPNMTFQHFLNARRCSPNAVPPQQFHSRTRQQRQSYPSLPTTNYAMPNPLRIYTGPDCEAAAHQHDHFTQLSRYERGAMPNGLPTLDRQNEHCAPRYQPSFFIEEAIAFPDDQSMFDPTASVWTTAPQPIFPFRPVDSHHAEHFASNALPCTSPDVIQPMKIETSPCMPALSLLDGDVDASNYELVSNDDWALASTDYGPSPASTHGPFTPLDFDNSNNGNEVFHHQHSVAAWTAAHQQQSSNRSTAQHGNDGIFQPHVLEDASIPSSVYGSNPSSTWSSGPSNLSASFSSNASFNHHHPTIETQPQYAHPSHLTHPTTLDPTNSNNNPIFHPPNPLLPSTSLYAPNSRCPSINSSSPEAEFPPPNPVRNSIPTTLETHPTTTTPATATETAHRRNRDLYLLEMRHKGHSYKTIKRRGGFREAESTLRGRVRVLTKEKWERVRRPEWTAEDLQLLRQAVRHFQQVAREDGEKGVARGGGGGGGAGKIPWKKVSERIRETGGTYLFAPATCAKKWLDGCR